MLSFINLQSFLGNMIQKDLVVGMLWCYTEKAVDNPMKFIQKALSLRKVDIFLAPEYLFLGKGMFTQERKLYSKGIMGLFWNHW